MGAGGPEVRGASPGPGACWHRVPRPVQVGGARGRLGAPATAACACTGVPPRSQQTAGTYLMDLRLWWPQREEGAGVGRGARTC